MSGLRIYAAILAVVSGYFIYADLQKHDPVIWVWVVAFSTAAVAAISGKRPVEVHVSVRKPGSKKKNG